MRILILIAILLAFPVAEVWLLIELASRVGWWLLGYLLLAAAAGWWLIMDEQFTVFERVVEGLHAGQHPGLALLASAKTLVAGLLLIFPGALTDAFALLLLFLPVDALRRARGGKAAARDDVIEGEWRRED